MTKTTAVNKKVTVKTSTAKATATVKKSKSKVADKTAEVMNVPTTDTPIVPPAKEEEIVGALPADKTVEKKYYTKEFVQTVTSYTDKIHTCLSTTRDCFCEIALALAWIDENKGYVSFGYDNFATFAKGEFDMEKTTAYDFVKIAQRFGIRDEGTKALTQLDDRFASFSSSQLSVIRELSDDEIIQNNVTSEMSVRDLKKLKKKILSKATPTTADGKPQPKGKPTTATADNAGQANNNIIDVDHKEITTELLKTYTDFKAFENDDNLRELLQLVHDSIADGYTITIHREKAV